LPHNHGLAALLH